MTKEQAVRLADKINQQIAERGNTKCIYSGSAYDAAFPLLLNTDTTEYQIIMRRSDTMVGDYRLVPLSWLRFKLGEELALSID